MEYLELTTIGMNSEVTFSSSWVIDTTLALVIPRKGHSVLSLGSSHIVAGGSSSPVQFNQSDLDFDGDWDLNSSESRKIAIYQFVVPRSVEVLDTKNGIGFCPKLRYTTL